MKTWKEISLFTFQQLEKISNDPHLDELDKVCFCTCEVFGLTEYQLDNMAPKKAAKKIRQVVKLMESKPEGKVRKRIGKYTLNYDPADLTLGQFVELRHFLQGQVHSAQYALASIARVVGTTYKSDGHPIRADYFLRQPVADVLACLNCFAERYSEFLKGYNALFGLDVELYTVGEQAKSFNRRYGWVYSATAIAEHERITLDQAYGLPIRQAFNDLMYLKAKGRYQAEEQKVLMNQAKKK